MNFFKNSGPVPENLRICLVANKFPILGRSADHGFLWPIAKGLAAKGHEVVVIAWRNPRGQKLVEQDGVQAFFLGDYNIPVKSFPEMVMQKFAELHSKEPFHLVHSVDFSGIKIGLRKKQFNVAVTYDVEATHMADIFNILGMSQDSISSIIRSGLAVGFTFLKTFYGFDRKLLKTADGVFVTSPLQRIILERYYLFPEYRTYSVPYGIEIGEVAPKKGTDELKKELSLPANAKTVVTLTDMSEIEEVRNVLRAFEKLAIKRHSARLIIIGDGPLKKEIEFEMYNLALGGRVIFAGSVENIKIADYISVSDIFVNISSRSTGFEPTLLVAMAQKKVIIGSEVSPMSTIVEDGIDGFLVRPADVTNLAKLFIQISEGKLPIDEIKENAHQKVTELFDTDKMVETTVDAFYQTLIKTKAYRAAPKTPTNA